MLKTIAETPRVVVLDSLSDSDPTLPLDIPTIATLEFGTLEHNPPRGSTKARYSAVRDVNR